MRRLWLVGLVALGWVRGVQAEPAPTMCIEQGEDGELIARPCPTRAGSPPSQTSAREPSPGASTAELPSSTDTTGVHRYVEAVANHPDERAAMKDFEALVAGGDPYAPALAALYLNPGGELRCRWVAGQALGRMKGPAAVAAINKGLSDKMPMARIAAVQALPYQQPGDARLRLEEALSDPAAVVRASAADSLAALGDPRAVPALVEAFGAPHNRYKGKSLFVRNHIVQALGRLGGQAAVATLIQALEDPDLTADACRALGQATGRTAAPPGQGTEAQRWAAWFNAGAR